LLLEGWILQQKRSQCKKISPTCYSDGWRLVLARGAFCNPAEKNYSPIEGKATTIFKGLQDTSYYTLGCKNCYRSPAPGHQPLVNTLGKQSVADVPNKRLTRIKEKTMCKWFEMIYNPGKLQSAADTLSRCRPLHMLYVSLDQVKNYDQDDELKKFLELNPESLIVKPIILLEPELELFTSKYFIGAGAKAPFYFGGARAWSFWALHYF
jgi:hypothetical protein